VKQIALNDESHFQLISGLWKGERGPLKLGRVIRATNFSGDGLLDFDDVVELSVEERYFAERRLAHGDIIVERSGGGPKQPVGRIAIFIPPDNHSYFSSNFTTALRVLERNTFDPEYVALYLHALYLAGATETLQRATTGIRNLDWYEYLRFEVPVLPLDAQKKLVRIIGGVRKAYRIERQQVDVLTELKRAAMRDLFTRGLRGEPQKETEIGLVPESWEIVPLGSICIATDQVDLTTEGSRRIQYIDVSCVSREALAVVTTNEYLLRDAPGRARKRVFNGDVIFATIRPTLCRVARIPPEMDNQVCSTAFCVLRTNDPRELGKFIFYAIQRPEFIDLLARIETGASYPAVTDRQVKAQPIPLPQKEERDEIVAILDAIDRKIELHRKKREVLEELFKALLHKLMTGEIRVDELDSSALVTATERGLACR
jgi:type I restriction enzyme S subunit